MAPAAPAPAAKDEAFESRLDEFLETESTEADPRAMREILIRDRQMWVNTLAKARFDYRVAVHVEDDAMKKQARDLAGKCLKARDKIDEELAALDEVLGKG